MRYEGGTSHTLNQDDSILIACLGSRSHVGQCSFLPPRGLNTCILFARIETSRRKPSSYEPDREVASG